MDIALATLLSPIVLFFLLGLGAALLKSQMTIPEAFAKGLAIYLMMSIGLKGGVAISKGDLGWDAGFVMISAVALSFLLPVIAYGLLRLTTRLGAVDAAATAAHYGSISIVTFVAAGQAIAAAGLETSGYLVAVAALMEVPAIISALIIAHRSPGSQESVAGSDRGELAREVMLNASVVVLIGSLMIGWISGEGGMKTVAPFFVEPFQGVLCLFLLDMGLSAGRGLRNGWRQLGPGAIAFGVYMPLVSGLLATGVAALNGMGTGDAALLITLAASASYIAVPAAMRLALPKARPSIYLTLSLGITFPFNLILGLPLYIWLAKAITPGAA
ncbi:MAG: sodium-dependent bicarbonate transport family permease [Hyphomonas sp.]|uniref:sodium-dependent bicarbonate transport family permease n=1 Tax=Hyphomonas sp. TaxID=87 RepID=UPI0034A04FFA